MKLINKRRTNYGYICKSKSNSYLKAKIRKELLTTWRWRVAKGK